MSEWWTDEDDNLRLGRKKSGPRQVTVRPEMGPLTFGT